MTMTVNDEGVLRFRDAQVADLDRIKALEAALYPADEAATPERLEFRLDAAAQFFRCCELERSLGTGPLLIGYICGTQSRDELTEKSMASHDPRGNLLCVHSVVVDAEYQRRGIATAMLRDYIRHVRSLQGPTGKIVLIAKADKCALYEKCGFVVVRESPVNHGQDRWNELMLDL